MAMTTMEKSVLESCKSAALSCHSTAGLLASLRSSSVKLPNLPQACKLVRQAEALCRSATALLAQKAPVQVAHPDSADLADLPMADAQSKKKQRKRRTKKSKDAKMPAASGNDMDATLSGSSTSAQMLVTPAGLESIREALGGLLPSVGTSAAGAMGGPNSPPFFPVGSCVILKGLNQANLNNVPATVCPDPEAHKNDMRIAVRLNSDGRALRVKRDNLIMSANQPYGIQGVTGNLTSTDDDDRDPC